VDKMGIAVIAATAAAVTCAAMGYVFVSSQAGKTRRQRIDTFVRKVSTGAVETRDLRAEIQRKKVNNRLRSLDEQKRLSKTRIGAVSALIQRAGLEMSVTRFWVACIIMGLGASAFSALQRMAPWVGPLSGVGFGLLVPILFLKFLAGRRAKEFTKHFVGAVDIITRGLRSGLPPQECFRMIAKDVPDPCGAIFRKIIDETNAGMSVSEAMQRAYQRMPTQEFMFFCTVISVQEQTGGNLADILDNISKLLRSRTALKEKVKALSGEARASAMIVGILPFAVSGILYIVNYDYISLLWVTRMGQFFLGAAVLMMGTGVLVMLRMGKIDM
jgi:tight adherence protein B